MKLHYNIPLSSLSYYRIGGKAQTVLEVTSEQDIRNALEYRKDNSIENLLVLGMGANLLLSDKQFDGLVLWLHGDGSGCQLIGKDAIKVFAGESMDTLLQYSLRNGLVGLEWAGGLPSTVGGAVRGNAGAFGSEIRNTVLEVSSIDYASDDKRLYTFKNEDCSFSYRHSIFKDNPSFLITSVTFQLRAGTKEEVEKAWQTYHENIAYRKKNHPMEYPSCGSVYMNIVKKDEVDTILSIWPDVKKISDEKWHGKISMGYIIHRLGFTGKKVGDAQVSPKHSNYIVNVGQARSDDVIEIINDIKDRFHQTFGFYPTPEVMIQEIT